MIQLPIFRRLIQVLRRPDARNLAVLSVVLLLILLVFAIVFSQYEEGVSFNDGLWTAYVTLTTIGYGDFSAKTLEGRIVTVVASMIGIGCFGVLTGMILEKAIQRRTRKMKGEGSYNGSGHLTIINVPSYEEIRDLLRELDLSPDFRDAPRILITATLPGGDKELPDFIANKIDGYIAGLPSMLETLERANVKTSRGCLLMSSPSTPMMDDTNALTAGLIEKRWPEVVTVMACGRAETLRNLKDFNIDGGVSAVNLQMGLMVQELEDPGVFEVYSQLSSNSNGNQIYISRTPVSAWNATQAISFGQLKISAIQMNFPVEIMGLKRENEENLLLNPVNSLNLEGGDRLVYLAKRRFPWYENSGKLIQQIQSHES